MIVHWHRRDLRPGDNRGLARAASADEPVVPLFVLDPSVLEHASPVRVACLLEALESLRSWYDAHGSDLLVVRGEASAAVPRVATAHDAATVVWNEDYSGLARERDQAVRAALADEGIAAESVHDAVHHEPGSITPNQAITTRSFPTSGRSGATATSERRPTSPSRATSRPSRATRFRRSRISGSTSPRRRRRR